MACVDLLLKVSDREAVADQAQPVTVAVVVTELRVAGMDRMVLDQAEVDMARQVAEDMVHLQVVEDMALQQEAMEVP